MEPVPSFQHAREQAALTKAQQTYVDQFVQAHIEAQLSTLPRGEAEAEGHLHLAYQVVGLAPPQIRWFDSPLAFLLAPESPPQSIELLLRTSVEAKVTAIIAERLSLPVWDELCSMLNVIGDSVWHAVGGLIHDALLERVGRTIGNKSSTAPRVFTKYDLPTTLWSAAGASLWSTYYGSSSYLLTSQRIQDSVQAYENQAWLVFSALFADALEPHDLMHLARFNELVSGYCLGRTEAWLVRKPTQIARDHQGLLHGEDGPCLRYPDGWGISAWHGARVPEKLILHPEQVTLEDWLHQKDENVRRAIQERIGHQRFAEMVGGCLVDEHGALVVDVGQGPERTGYVVHMQGDTPRVCLFPRVFFERQCQQHCSHPRPCPLLSDVYL